MFLHLIPLEELKRHSVTYWLPGRDQGVSADTWVVLREVESGYTSTLLDVPAEAGADEALELFLRVSSTPGGRNV